MSSDPQPEDDPRPKRALFLGGALLAAIVLYNADWWSGGDVPVVVIDRGDHDEARDEVRQALRNARDDIRDSIREGRDEARQAIEDAQGEAPTDDEEAADEPTEETGVSIERTDEDGVRITIGG